MKLECFRTVIWIKLYINSMYLVTMLLLVCYIFEYGYRSSSSMSTLSSLLPSWSPNLSDSSTCLGVLDFMRISIAFIKYFCLPSRTALIATLKIRTRSLMSVVVLWCLKPFLLSAKYSSHLKCASCAFVISRSRGVWGRFLFCLKLPLSRPKQNISNKTWS